MIALMLVIGCWFGWLVYRIQLALERREVLRAIFERGCGVDCGSWPIEDLDETTRLVNPAYRRLDGAVRKQVAVLRRQQANFGALTRDGELEGNKLSE